MIVVLDPPPVTCQSCPMGQINAGLKGWVRGGLTDVDDGVDM